MAHYIICPFFQYEKNDKKNQRINFSCEGITMRFPSREHVNKVVCKYCETFNYIECKHAQKAQAKYKER